MLDDLKKKKDKIVWIFAKDSLLNKRNKSSETCSMFFYKRTTDRTESHFDISVFQIFF